MSDPSIAESARTMSVVLAPVFLISGVAVVLSAMITRYGRVIDRVRAVLREAIINVNRNATTDPTIQELRQLYRRAKLLRSAIICASASIFCVSITVFLLFASLILELRILWAPEVLFIISLSFLILAMGLFIEDFAISLRILKLEVNSRLQHDVLKDK